MASIFASSLVMSAAVDGVVGVVDGAVTVCGCCFLFSCSCGVPFKLNFSHPELSSFRCSLISCLQVKHENVFSNFCDNSLKVPPPEHTFFPTSSVHVLLLPSQPVLAGRLRFSLVLFSLLFLSLMLLPVFPSCHFGTLPIGSLSSRFVSYRITVTNVTA